MLNLWKVMVILICVNVYGVLSYFIGLKLGREFEKKKKKTGEEIEVKK